MPDTNLSQKHKRPREDPEPLVQVEATRLELVTSSMPWKRSTKTELRPQFQVIGLTGDFHLVVFPPARKPGESEGDHRGSGPKVKILTYAADLASITSDYAGPDELSSRTTTRGGFGLPSGAPPSPS